MEVETHRDPSGACTDIPHAAHFSVEKLLPIHNIAPVVQLQVPEPLSAEGGHEKVAFPLRDGPFDHDLRPARGGLRGRPDGDGVDVALVLSTSALDRWPAVVLPCFDPVDLVPGARAELAGVELSPPSPTRAPPRCDGRRSRRGCRGTGCPEGWNRLALLSESYLPGSSGPGSSLISCVARAHVEHAVRAELDPTPVVIRVGGNSRKYRLGILPRYGTLRPGCLPGRIVGVDVAVILVVRGDGDAEKPALARATLWQGLDLLNVT